MSVREGHWDAVVAERDAAQAEIERLKGVLSYCGAALNHTAEFKGIDWTLARRAVAACVPGPYDAEKVLRIVLNVVDAAETSHPPGRGDKEQR